MPARTIQVTELAEAISRRLEDEDMTVRQAAAIVGVSPQTVLNWADGKSIQDFPKHQLGIAKLLSESPAAVAQLNGIDLSDEALGAWLTSLLEGAA